MYICIYTCVCIYVYIYTHIYVPQICFPFPFFSALLHTKLAQVFDIFFVNLSKESSWNKFFINQDFGICKATYMTIKTKEKEIFHAGKSFLYNNAGLWINNQSHCFDVTVELYDRAEMCKVSSISWF